MIFKMVTSSISKFDLRSFILLLIIVSLDELFIELYVSVVLLFPNPISLAMTEA